MGNVVWDESEWEWGGKSEKKRRGMEAPKALCLIDKVESLGNAVHVSSPLTRILLPSVVCLSTNFLWHQVNAWSDIISLEWWSLAHIFGNHIRKCRNWTVFFHHFFGNALQFHTRLRQIVFEFPQSSLQSHITTFFFATFCRRRETHREEMTKRWDWMQYFAIRQWHLLKSIVDLRVIFFHFAHDDSVLLT